ncbi:MAG: ABC transporter ATP-binding protein, partial [Ferruginibacter sp.]|nr:ABC transporter ATP-binding protein [Rhodoferax sp.]
MSTPSSTLLEFRNLSFAYQDDVVLHDVSLHLPRGKVTALIGPAGAG